MSERPKPTFDPRPHLIQIRSKGQVSDYLPVQKRVLWLRTEYPDAVINIELLEWNPDFALAKATVAIPGGGTATDYGSETKTDFPDFIEKACTKALGRALAGLGFGTQFCADELDLVNPDGSPHWVDSPVVQRPVVRSTQPAAPRPAGRATNAPYRQSTPRPTRAAAGGSD